MTREHEPTTENRFRQEALESLNAIQDALLDLFESTAEGASFDRQLDGVLSHGRSLRGAAEEAQWRGMVGLSQRLEENLQRIRLYRPQLGLKLRNLWRQALAALQAAIAVQGESPFGDRIGVEATAAEALDRLEWHFTEVPSADDPWAELEHCLRLLESLRGEWQTVAEVQADVVAVQESLAAVGIAIPDVAAIGQWLAEASASCQDFGQWQELGDQTIQRLQEVLGQVGDRPPAPRLVYPQGEEGPFELPDVNDTELFVSEENADLVDPFAWFESVAEASVGFFDDGMVGEAFAQAGEPPPAEDFLGKEENPPTQALDLWGEDPSPAASEFGGAIAPDTAEVATVDDIFNEALPTADLNLWAEPTPHAETESGKEPDFPVTLPPTEEGATAEDVFNDVFNNEALPTADLALWTEPTPQAETASGEEPDFPVTLPPTEEAAAAADVFSEALPTADLALWAEPTPHAETESGKEPDFPVTLPPTEEAAAAADVFNDVFNNEALPTADLALWAEPTPHAETESVREPDFPTPVPDEPAPKELEDLNFWSEAGYDAGVVAEMDVMAELRPLLENAAPDSNRSFLSSESPPQNLKEEGDTDEISLDSLLTDLGETLANMEEVSALVSLESPAQPRAETSPELSTALAGGDFIDLEQTLAAEPVISSTEFEALNFDLSDDVADETQNLLDVSHRLSAFAATFDGEPPALPNVQPVSRPVFSGVESVVFAPMDSPPTALPSHPWSAQLLYDVAADLGAGQIALNWQLQQLRTAVRSLLGNARNLGAPTEAAAELPNGAVPEGLLRLREISEDIDLALFEMEQANADRQRQIWQVQELAREERLCSLGGLGQQLAQGLALPSVQLIVENSTVAVDRAFVNKLVGPLGDLLRLLAERSIEGPAERQRQGKPVVGTLRVRGVAVGDTLSLEITDDGAGLPFDIFQPGAPGAAIAHGCQALGVALRPDFTTGRGSRVSLQLPYVLLMTRVLLLRIGAAMVAVRTEHVRDILAVPPGDSRTVVWGHRTIPWLHAQDRLRVNCRRQELPVFEAPDQENVLVVLQSGENPYALTVDACWREQEATLQRLAGGMALSFPFCGCAVLADSRVIPLFSPSEMLLQPNEDNTQLRLLEKQKRQSAREILARRSPQLILLVDDSINVRRYLASLLEGAGFATVQARDGLEALEKLDNGLQPGAIISDLEMPRMDGYTLLQQVRAREISRNVPFVVLTSRTNERHRQQAEALGATAYVNKPYRNEEMIGLMRRLTAPATDS